jgi:pyridoxine 5-phosphate synthase
LVPERREERTTEGGLDCVEASATLRRVAAELVEPGIPLSMFIDPDCAQVDASRDLGAPIIELHTGDYAQAQGAEAEQHLDTIHKAALHGASHGLVVAAGHGLTCRNVGALLQIPEIVEYNIGHAIVARALFVGLDTAVREMIDVLAS